MVSVSEHRIKGGLVAVVALPWLLVSIALGADADRQEASPRASERVELPIVFEPNLGQAHPDIRFFSRLHGYTALLLADRILLAFDPTPNGAIEQIELVPRGAGANACWESEEPTGGASHYLVGADAASWVRGIPHYRSIVWRDVRPGFDIRVYSRDGKLEFDVIAAAGTDPNDLELEIRGASSVEAVDERVLIHLEHRALELAPPIVYQEVGGHRIELEAAYRISGTHLRFEVRGADPTRAVVVDPVVSYASYIGGSSGESGNAIRVDTDGSAIIAGTSQSIIFGTDIAPECTRFPQCDNPPENAFVIKLRPDGSIEFATFLGGAGRDSASDIALAFGTIYVTGVTYSVDFPTTEGALKRNLGGVFNEVGDAFVTGISPDGSSLVMSTYLGGSDHDEAHGLVVYAFLEIGQGFRHYPVVVGSTSSMNFPVTDGSTYQGGGDAFVTRLSHGATGIEFSRLLGGSARDEALAVARQPNTSVLHIVGTTASANFPTMNAYSATRSGGDDAFIAKISSTGALLYSTFLGGSGSDSARGVATQNDGSTYVVGVTSSTNFPRQASSSYGGGDTDAFLTKLSPAGNSLVYSTYIGGSGRDLAEAVEVNAVGEACVTGFTLSNNFPKVSPLTAPASAASGLVWVARWQSSGGAPQFASTFGGAEGFDSGRGIAVANDGSIWITGTTSSDDFSLVGVLGNLGGSSDAFVVKIEEASNLTADLSITKEVTPLRADVGETILYSLRIENHGPQTAAEIVVEDTLPGGITDVELDDGCTLVGNTVVCTREALGSGFGYTIRIEAVAESPGRWTNEASVTAASMDPDASNNTAIIAHDIVVQLDIVIDEIEVTQAIQDLDNDVPLAAGKPTLVRVYPRLIHTDPNATFGGVDYLLQGTRDGAPLPGSPIAPISAPANLGQSWDREEVNSTVLFLLPASWREVADSVTFRAVADSSGAVVESSEANNTRSVTVKFWDAAPICLRTYRVRTVSGTPDANYLVSDPDGIHMVRRASSLIPTPEIRVFPRDKVIQRRGLCPGCTLPWNLDNWSQGERLQYRIWKAGLISRDPLFCRSRRARTHGTGLVPPHPNVAGGGLGFDCRLGFKNALWFVLDTRSGASVNGLFINALDGGVTLAHELGHNYCRRHVSCSAPGDPLPAQGDPNYPYANVCTFADSGMREPYGTDLFGALDGSMGFASFHSTSIMPSIGDLMSYRTTTWISAYTWTGFLGSLFCQKKDFCVFDPDDIPANAQAHARDGAAHGIIPDELLLISGSYDHETREVQFLEMTRIETDAIAPERLADLLIEAVEFSGEIIVEVLDSSGTTLVADEIPTGHADEFSPNEFFAGALPWLPGAASVRVSISGHGEIEHRRPSETSPEVDIIAPRGGERFAGPFRIEWDAFDPDPGEGLYYTVQYTRDGGESWEVIADEIFETRMTFDPKYLGGTQEGCRIRVIASDGFLTGSAISEPFSVGNQPPHARIESPAHGAVVPAGYPVILVGSAIDPEEEELANEGFHWLLDGAPVGVGREIVLGQVTPGIRLATLEVEDSFGNIGRSEISFIYAIERTAKGEQEILADSIRDWDATGRQESNGWLYGFYDAGSDRDRRYARADFVPYRNLVGPEGGEVSPAGNHWTGGAWSVLAGETGLLAAIAPDRAFPEHPVANGELWVIRRWISSTDGPASVIWHARTSSLASSGVTAHLFANGELIDSMTIAPGDTRGRFHARTIALSAGMAIDLAISPIGPGGDRADEGDVAISWMRVVRGASDLDADGITDDVDNCSTVRNGSQADVDRDGIGNECDNCPGVANPDQSDSDGNGIGDACENDGPARFLRGDSNADGALNISDASALLNWLFLGGEPIFCEDAADGNDDGSVDISDAISVLGYLFLGGAAPPAPGANACGEDPTSDDLPPCQYPASACE